MLMYKNNAFCCPRTTTTNILTQFIKLCIFVKHNDSFKLLQQALKKRICLTVIKEKYNDQFRAWNIIITLRK
jgi:hypothetical protein